jgi:hypothetical protein
MGVGVGKAQEGIQPVDQLFAADMFQLFGDLMYLVPAELQFFDQEIFPQPMLADDLDGGFFPSLFSLKPLYRS